MRAALLLDTCACIWLLSGSHMKREAVDAIDEAADRDALFVSPFTAWEVSRLAAVGRLGTRSDPRRWFARLVAMPGVKIAALTGEILIESNWLVGEPPRDPADRILIATARSLGCPLVTRDRPIIAYAEAGHLDVIVC